MPLPSTTRTLILPETGEKQTINDFDSIKLGIASPEDILSWSHGEVIFPETINYRTQKPERDGLFCEKIFGPVKDWECACGKYKKVRYRGIVCDRCGVEVTRSLVRRERMGHISLAAPVTHIWFLRGVPSRIGLFLDLSVQALEKIVYFASFVIVSVDEELKKETLDQLEEEFKDKKSEFKKQFSVKVEFEKSLTGLNEAYQTTKKEIESLKMSSLLSEITYRSLSVKYGHIFNAKIGAEAIFTLLSKVDLSKLAHDLEKEKRKTINPGKRKKIIQRLQLVRNSINNKIKPEWMVLKVIPVIPPDLRPMVQLDGGRFASSDLNDLYRRIINRNNRLKRLIDLGAPEIILRNEKRMLQEATDALTDNEMRTNKTVTASTGQKRPLKSLADILKGKQGRFRQNLLGKRVDYSGRSVITIGPHLKLDQCGLPKMMAIELFRPFVISRLIKSDVVHNVRSANRYIETGAKEVWDILEDITKNSYVLLNRAPTLHRLGIQAFHPILIEGKAIQIHPFVCAAFNADFDGDQMAVHVPITEKAKEEAATIMLSSHNLLKPATGEPIIAPTKDMVWGAYYMTTVIEKLGSEIKSFANVDEAILVYDFNKIGIQDKIKVNLGKNNIIETCVGRLIFNSVLPRGIYNLDKQIDGKLMKSLLAKCIEQFSSEEVVAIFDQVKSLTLKYLTLSGMSWGLNDLPELNEKPAILKKAEEKINEIEKQYEDGLLAEDERYLKTIDVWTRTKDEITDLCKRSFNPYSSVMSMVNSGARGSWTQLTQMAGMKGIVGSPSGRLIELPVKSSFKEGLDVLEYFISTHGARKGTSDTALRTASAGYLTRRLVDVSQDVVVREEDCGDKEGILITKKDSEEMGETIWHRVINRFAAKKIIDPKTKKVIVKAGELIDEEKVKILEKTNIEQVNIRSVMSCETLRGVCAKCYGFDLSVNKLVAMGVPVGIMAAQSIGEPGTQLTLRTFHTGGVAGKDITQGLPRVEELFEVRPPKQKAIMAKHDGLASVETVNDLKNIKIKHHGFKEDIYLLDEDIKWEIKVKNAEEIKKGDVLVKSEKKSIKSKHTGKVKLKDGQIIVSYEADDIEEYDVPINYAVWIKNGEKVKAGDQLTEGSLDLREIYELRGKEAVRNYVLKEIQYIYTSQGQKLNDKHIEIIIKQMFSRVSVIDGGDTELLSGDIVPIFFLLECNRTAEKAEKKPAQYQELLLGISRASLSTDSFLAAASFQETSRVLIAAAVNGWPDKLYGLKENVILGRVIPAGTGWLEHHKKKA
ncbi:MAG: DNA-directed RNA polymerase subunit beta', partial [Patescibacteria group bacterium]